MREVSCRATRMMIEVLEAAGMRPEPLAEGLPATLAELRDPRHRIDWDVYVRVLERVEQLCAGTLTIEEIGARMVTAPSNDLFRRAGKLVLSPRDLYRIGERLIAPSLFANVIVKHEALGGRRLVVTGEVQPGFRPSEAFFRLCHANVAEVTRVLDLPPAEIEEQSYSGTRGRLVLVLPHSHTIATRVVRGARALRGLGETFRGVAREQAALEQSLGALRASRQEFQQLLERLPTGVFLHRAGVVCWANTVMLRDLGYASLGDVVGREMLSFLPPEDRRRLAERMAKNGSRRVGREAEEFRVLRADGSMRRLEAAAAQNVEYEGAPARLVVCRDVTERRRLQEQLVLAERLASLGTLAAGVAHEINNPLAFVQTSLDVAAREIEALRPFAGARVARIEEALGHAREGTQRVRGIVRDLQTLSHGEDEPLGAVDVEELLRSTLALAARAMETRARVVRRSGPIPRARATQGRLGQVLLNLFLNAADAIPEGAPLRHEIRVTTSTDASGRAVIEVADDGLGIPPEVARRIFDPFFTTKPVGAGTGLGLAICHRIVTQLGGELTFESTHGAGTTFRVALPSALEAAAPAPAIEARAQAARTRVLVVDDEPGMLRSVRWLLADQHDVVVASSGSEALELLRGDRRFDVVLADLMMAGLTGMDLYDAVRELDPALQRRMVFMTGGAFTRRGHEFLASVPNRCIEKPFSEAELMDAIAFSAAQ